MVRVRVRVRVRARVRVRVRVSALHTDCVHTACTLHAHYECCRVIPMRLHRLCTGSEMSGGNTVTCNTVTCTGSEMSGGVANVRAADLVLRDVAVGLRIKAAPRVITTYWGDPV